MNRDTIVKYIGKVEGINYSESDKYPRLEIEPSSSYTTEFPDGFNILNNDLMKAIRRNLITGDTIEYRVNDDTNDLLGVRIINKALFEPGRVRHLSIHYDDVDFEKFRKEGSKSGEIGDFYGDVVELGETVYRLDWTGMYSGVVLIVRLGNSYFSDLEEGVIGPFSTLIDAIKESELDYFSKATESIECTELDSETLASLLKTYERIEPRFKLFLNGEEWELDEHSILKKINL